ncbi:hypothetical protein R0H32_010475 [Vibrio cholerae]|uniref:hypothetical protein n=2 Tax=Vibrio cholerae TaxID=666 RepID=UPI0029356243|nr:hypothetical protein [Vibrio cholerae]MDW4535188.1 hypothetical protein [Vibrio cholerae]
MKMNKKNKYLYLEVIQLIALILYFHFNIINIGEGGREIGLLVVFFIITIVMLFLRSFNEIMVIKIHLFVFFMLIIWISIRVITDKADLEFLKQITIATTGGMFLFYCIGVALSLSFYRILYIDHSYRPRWLCIYILFGYGILSFFVLKIFYENMSESHFYLKNIKGLYQRPGNFLSILFIFISYVYLSVSLSFFLNKKLIGLLIVSFVYSVLTIVNMVNSQLLGSNSATGVIVSIYVLTIVVMIYSCSGKIINLYLLNRSRTYFSFFALCRLFLIFMSMAISFITLLILVSYVIDFNLNKLNLFGLGAGKITSLTSRFDILASAGLEQMSFSLFWGNIDVAYLTTGNSGKTLHNFFPFIIANLGVFGFLIVVMLFLFVFNEYVKSIRLDCNLSGLLIYTNSVFNFYSLLIFTFLVIFANFTTDVSWIVLWFFIGFSTRPIMLEKIHAKKFTF